MLPLVSVIVPIHKYQDYIHAAIKSILDQTYKNIEVIIVNDSNDFRLEETIHAFKDERIKIIQGSGKGLADALNLAVSNVNGEFIARMDADDISEPNRLTAQLHFLNLHGLDICGTNIKTFGVSSEKITFPETNEEIKFSLLFSCPIAHPTILIKANILKENKYNFQTSAAEDYELWITLASLGFRFGNCQEFLLKYRTHQEQASKINFNQLQNSIAVAKKYSLIYLDEKASKKFNSLDCAFSKKYSTAEVNELMDILAAEIQKKEINPKILNRLLISLYTRVTDYTFTTLSNFLNSLHRLRILRSNKKFIFYLLFRSMVRKEISPKKLRLFEKVYRRSAN